MKQTSFICILCIIGVIILFIGQNYIIPKYSIYSYYNNFDTTKSILLKYKTPNDLLNALHNKTISCNDLTRDIINIINNVEKGICRI